MAIPLKDLFYKNHTFWKKDNNQKCPKCKTPLQSISSDEYLEILQRGYCDNCYYESLGEEIEKHPIYSPRVHRG